MPDFAGSTGSIGKNTLDVVAMYPVEASFWDRLEVSTSLGFSWDKGSSVGKYTFGLDAEYRATEHLTRGGLTAEVTTQDNQEDTRRASANITHMRFRQNKRFISYFANADSNNELGIDLRLLGGIGYGWVPIRSSRKLFLLTAGADVDAVDANGTSALIAASARGHLEVVNALLDGGADVNLKDAAGRSAMARATLRDHTAIVGVLKAAGAVEEGGDDKDAKQ